MIAARRGVGISPLLEGVFQLEEIPIEEDAHNTSTERYHRLENKHEAE